MELCRTNLCQAYPKHRFLASVSKTCSQGGKDIKSTVMVYEVGSRYPESGDKVKIIQKKDYASGALTEGTVKDVLTSKRFHPRGHKVRLPNGVIGRVQEFSDEKEKPPKPTVSYPPSEDDLA